MADEDDDAEGPWTRYAGPAPSEPDEDTNGITDAARGAWDAALAAAQPALQRQSGASGTGLPPVGGSPEGEGATSSFGSTSSPTGPSHDAVMADINSVLDQLNRMPSNSTVRSTGGGGGGARGRMFFPPSRAAGAAPAIPPTRAPLLSPAQAERRQDTRERTDQLGNSLRIFEDLLGDWSAEQKAHAIHQQYGLRVDPQALRRGTVWWRKQRT